METTHHSILYSTIVYYDITMLGPQEASLIFGNTDLSGEFRVEPFLV